MCCLLCKVSTDCLISQNTNKSIQQKQLQIPAPGMDKSCSRTGQGKSCSRTGQGWLSRTSRKSLGAPRTPGWPSVSSAPSSQETAALSHPGLHEQEYSQQIWGRILLHCPGPACCPQLEAPTCRTDTDLLERLPERSPKGLGTRVQGAPHRL